MTVASNTVIGTLPGGTEVVAASLEAGRELLTTVDDYLSQQSPFDRQARVNLRRQVVEVTLPMYLDYIASQVMSWSQAEIKALGAIVSAMAKLFAPLSLPLPAEIHLVKTSGQEEGYAAYTRLKDTIAEHLRMLDAARLLTWRAAWMGDNGVPNTKEASMSKAFAGRVATNACAACVDVMGADGLDPDAFVEKWFRDIKVYDIFEGTGQVQRVVIAKRLMESYDGR